MSPRLRFLLEQALPENPLWDIGCDHGYLGEAAFRSGKFPEVHFVDPVSAQIKAIERRLAFHLQKGESARFALYACRAEELERAVPGSVVMAGFGGGLMHSILRTWSAKNFLTAKRIVLSPHKDEKQLLEAMREFENYRISYEGEVTERGRRRPVICFDRIPVTH